MLPTLPGTEYGNQVTFTTSPVGLAVLTTTVPTLITGSATTALSGGNITSDGGGSVTERGVCWGTSAAPTIAGSHLANGSGTGIFTVTMTGLTEATIYHVRAYAVNSAGPAYGNEVTILTSMSDADGNVYKTVMISTQIWMAENLKTTKYRDGITDIPLETDNAGWAALTGPAYCWYNNDEANKAVYGALYNWFTVNTGNLCPTGWQRSDG